MEINAEQLKNNKLSTPVGESKKPGCCYTYIPRFIKRKDTTQEELTTLNLDKVTVNLILSFFFYNYICFNINDLFTKLFHRESEYSFSLKMIRIILHLFLSLLGLGLTL